MSITKEKRPECEEFKQWCIDNEPDDKMRFKPGYWSQIQFMRDQLYRVPFWDLADKAEVCKIEVYGTHTSKSVKLPVVKITYKGKGLGNDVYFEMIVSYNFHMWSVSVRCTEQIPETIVDLRLFNQDESSYCGLYGFKPEDELSSYRNNKREFSCTINTTYELWTFMRVITCMLENRAS